jgi:E3 ubiquitin-protein ligase DOA10
MEITQIINTQIIPVLLLPVTGLLVLTFYNKAGMMNQRIRFIQKELRDLLVNDKTENVRHSELIDTLSSELKALHQRSKVLFMAIRCCLLAIVIFSLCAIFIALGVFFTWAINIALLFWFIGPILISIGAIGGIIEVVKTAQTLSLQTLLIEKWDSDN